MHGRFAFEPLDGPFQRRNPPVIDFIKEDIECGFVKLDDVNAGRLQFPRFLIEDLGEFPGQFFAAFIMAVIQRIDHRHGTRQGPFNRLAGLLAQEFGVFHKNRLGAAHGAHDGRHARIVAVTNSDGLALVKIDSAQMLDKRGDEMLAGLLAIADDIDACLLLFLQGQT